MPVMFPEFEENLEVWRYVKPTGWGDPTFSLVATVRGHIEPVVSSAQFLNNQDFQGVSEVAFLDIVYENVVEPNDYIITPRGEQFKNIGIPETWRYIIPYVMLKLETSQEPVST